MLASRGGEGGQCHFPNFLGGGVSFFKIRRGLVSFWQITRKGCCNLPYFLLLLVSCLCELAVTTGRQLNINLPCNILLQVGGSHKCRTHHIMLSCCMCGIEITCKLHTKNVFWVSIVAWSNILNCRDWNLLFQFFILIVHRF